MIKYLNGITYDRNAFVQPKEEKTEGEHDNLQVRKLSRTEQELN